MVLKRLDAVILAGSKDPACARRLGFIPAKNLDQALDIARERVGTNAAIGYPVIPPLFCMDVAGRPAEAGGS